MIEIGSEFWLLSNTSYYTNNSFNHLVNFGEDLTLLFSGRTAIDYVLQDIPKEIKSVYMPSYCCASMLQPFVDSGINIEFYNVVQDKSGLRYVVDYKKEVDIFFAMSYFGFHDTAMDSYIEKFHKRNIIVIEDVTHRLLCLHNHCEKSHYYIASLRKWFPIPSGGLAIKKEGKFKEISLISPPQSLINKKVLAMKIKASYINKAKGKSSNDLKSEYLSLFSKFNKALPVNYKNFKIDDLSEELLSKINIEKIREKRRKNSGLIYKNYSHSPYIDLLIKNVDLRYDCPLFVPITVRMGMRDGLRKHLIENDIFCPIHWPIPLKTNINHETEKLYEQQLSLVCDHRYGPDHIKRMVNTLEEFTDLL